MKKLILVTIIFALLTGGVLAQENMWESDNPTSYSIQEQCDAINVDIKTLEPWRSMRRNQNHMAYFDAFMLIFPNLAQRLADRIAAGDHDGIFYIEDGLVVNYQICQDDVTGNPILWGPVKVDLDREYAFYRYVERIGDYVIEIFVNQDDCRNINIRWFYVPIPDKPDTPDNPPPDNPIPPPPEQAFFFWFPMSGWRYYSQVEVVEYEYKYLVGFGTEERDQKESWMALQRNTGNIYVSDIEDNDTIDQSQTQNQEQYINCGGEDTGCGNIQPVFPDDGGYVPGIESPPDSNCNNGTFCPTFPD